MSIQKAVFAAKFHHQCLPNKISFKPRRSLNDLLESVRKKKYYITTKNNVIIGKVVAIMITLDRTIEGGADKREDDKAAGF